ncbi:MAG: signal recognition particle protein [Firmicutes bacterium]|nr:signal recognition particle protein [Bacillota bacterium]
MAFENLAARLQETFKRLRGKGKLTEKDVEEALREVKLALLEADVNFKVVKDFIGRVKARAVGQEVLNSLTPGQQVVKVVYDELTELMGQTQSKLNFAAKPPTVIMMAGLQGSGKTTTAGKLALYLHKQGRRPLLVAGDVYRPAAIKQLEVLGEQLGIPVFSMGQGNPVEIAKTALEHAHSHGNDVVIIDTAGRLHIDEALMEELQAIRAAVAPQEILLVVDAMTGQDAVQVAETFNQRLELDGVVLTKLDGDARGGAALSVRAVTGKPIKFGAFGEKMDALEPFHPDRMASRILGMGDVLSLIEKAEATMDAEKARKMAEKLRSAEFTLEDFLEQLQQVKKMGPVDQLLGMLPDAAQLKGMGNVEVDPKQLARIEAIINSMTPRERQSPSIIDGSRRRRIALGSGTKVQDVNKLLKQFDQTRQMMKQLGVLEKKARKGGLLSFFK